MIGDLMHPCENKKQLKESIASGRKNILCYGDIEISKNLAQEIKKKEIKILSIKRGLKPNV
jgi:hypothetical protein